MRWLLALALVGCGGHGLGGGGEGSTCRDTGDCDTGLSCGGPDDRQPCGIAPRQECATDNDCQGMRCHAIADSCSPDGVGSECRLACTGDGECGAGFHCDNGACAAIPCTTGSCGALEVCDLSGITASTPIYDRTDGCRPIACTSDAPCGDGVCVNAVCQSGPGTCKKPLLVP
jgi:hypothetical protein